MKKPKALADLLRQVADGEEFTITQDGTPKGKLCAVPVAYHNLAYPHRGSADPRPLWLRMGIVICKPFQANHLSQ